MGKKFDALLGRSFKSSKFKRYVNLVVSRIAFLKIQHHVRCSQARCDVVHLLSLGQQESALLRVEHVIREQNMLDVFTIIEGYCRLLIERVLLIDNTKACPDELKEAVSSLIFAASRFGQLPELRKIRGLFTSKFGKQFATCATELRNDCGVNPKMVKKLPIRRPSLETRIKVLKEIAAENGVTLCIEGEASEPTEENDGRDLATITDPKLDDDAQNLPIDINRDKRFLNIMKSCKKYTDVATAAQEAFELAAHAAIAARAAIELSQLKLCEKGHVEPNTSDHQQKNVTDLGGFFKSCLHVDDDSTLKEIDYNDQSEKQVVQQKKSISSSSSPGLGSGCDKVNERKNTLFSIILGQNQELQNEIGFDEMRKEEEKEKSGFSFRDVNGRSRDENDLGDKEEIVENQTPKWFPWKDQNENELEAYSFEIRTTLETMHLSDSEESSQQSNKGRRPLSVRTKRMHRPLW